MSSVRFTRLSSSYFWYFGVLGLIIPFLAIFLDSKGFNSLAIGEILALITATKIVGPTLWAWFADKTGKLLFIIRFGAFLALLCFSFLFLMDSYWSITLTLSAFSLFWTAILPQLEVLTLNSVRRKPKIYARIRLWGSLGFVVVAFTCAEVITRWPQWGFILSGLFILLGLYLSTLMIKPTKLHASHIAKTSPLKDKIIHGGFICFFIASILLQISFGPYYSFFALYLRDFNYSGFAIGSLISLGVLAEVVIFIIAGRLFKRFSLRSLLFISLLLTAIRWYVTGNYADSMVMILIAQCIHAASFGVYHSAAITYIHQHFEVNQQSRGQALYISGVYGVGGALGAYLSGVIWLDGVGAVTAFNYAAIAAFIGAFFALFISSSNHKVIKT